MSFTTQIKCTVCNYMIDKVSTVIRSMHSSDKSLVTCPRCNYKIEETEMMEWENQHGWYLYTQEAYGQFKIQQMHDTIHKNMFEQNNPYKNMSRPAVSEQDLEEQRKRNSEFNKRIDSYGKDLR